MAIADTCITFTHDSSVSNRNENFNGCYVRANGDGDCNYARSPVGVENNKDWEIGYVKYEFGFLVDSVTWTSADFFMVVNGNGDDGWIELYTTQPFDTNTLSWSNRPDEHAYIGISDKHGSSRTSSPETDHFTHLPSIKEAFDGTSAYFMYVGEEDSDDDQAGHAYHYNSQGVYHYFKACYTGTPRICNPSDPCCNSAGTAYKSPGTPCGSIERASCTTASMSSCEGVAYEDRCTGTSASCPDSDNLIDYDQACNGIDVGTCAICKGGSVPVFDDDPNDCSTYDCDYLDTECRDYNDVRRCISVGVCANSASHCNSYTDQPTTTDCGTCGNCNAAGSCINDHAIVCDINSDCDDSNFYTRDTCLSAATCDASCTNELWCGNGACDGNETTANCPEDCHPQCGDGLCQGSEDCYNCEEDCGLCQGEVYGLIYDANGNLIQDDQFYYIYNSQNQLTEIKNNNETGVTLTKYYYDEQGQRIKKEVGDSTTHYINKNYIVADNEETIYYYLNGKIVGRKDSNGNTYYYHPDILGSTNLVTDQAGNEIARSDYLPFGGNDLDYRFTFTGQENDNESNLMYYDARYYSTSLRRFTQPDPYIQNIYDPQSLNRYAYVRNNPLKYTDPSGNFICGGACLFFAGVAAWTIAGAVVAAATNMISQIVSNDASMFDGTMDWGSAGKSAGYGAVGGFVSGITAGVVSPLFTGTTGAAAIIGSGATGAASVMMGGVATQATFNAANGNPLTENVFDAAVDGAVWGGVGGVASGAISQGVSAVKSSFTKPASLNPQRLPDWSLKIKGVVTTEKGFYNRYYGGGSKLEGGWLTPFDTNSGHTASRQLAKVVNSPGTNPYTHKTSVLLPKGTKVNIGYNVKGVPQIEVLDDLSKLHFPEGIKLR